MNMPQARTLSAKWTVDLSQDLESSMSETLAKEISAEIDFEVLDSMLNYQYEYDFRKRGGIVMNMDPRVMEEWCKKNTKDGYYHLNGVKWKFKTFKDLNWFKLRWI